VLGGALPSWVTNPDVRPRSRSGPGFTFFSSLPHLNRTQTFSNCSFFVPFLLQAQLVKLFPLPRLPPRSASSFLPSQPNCITNTCSFVSSSAKPPRPSSFLILTYLANTTKKTPPDILRYGCGYRPTRVQVRQEEGQQGHRTNRVSCPKHCFCCRSRHGRPGLPEPVHQGDSEVRLPARHACTDEAVAHGLEQEHSQCQQEDRTSPLTSPRANPVGHTTPANVATGKCHQARFHPQRPPRQICR
jgi:hypothetical protein